jgi:hypothetical protein
MAARKRTREQRSLDKGRPFITKGEMRSGNVRSQMSGVLKSDVFLRSTLTEGQIAFMRFKGVVTPRRWLISDQYRQYSREQFSQWCNLRRRYIEGAQRLQQASGS